MRNIFRQSKLILPLLALMGGGLAAPALALELDASNVASDLALAFEQRHLADAQVLVSQMASCGVQALRIDGVDYPVAKLGADITRLASDQPVSQMMDAPQSSAAFLLDASARPAASCDTDGAQEIAALSSAVELPAGGTPPPAEQPPAAPPPADEPPAADPAVTGELLCEPIHAAGGLCPYDPEDIAELCKPFEAMEVNCPLGGGLPLPPAPTTPEEAEAFCESFNLDPCPFTGNPAAPPVATALVLPPAAAGDTAPGTGEANALLAPVNEALDTVLDPAPPVVSDVVNEVLGLVDQ